MSMEYVVKALDTVQGANLLRQDLSATISITDGRPRPFLQNCPGKAKSKQVTHEWDEQALILPGSGAASYADGNLPTADVLDATQLSNVTCRIGKTATVTDDMTAAFTGGGAWVLADGQLEKLVQEAIDFQTELKTREVLDECEWMHISGNHTISSGFPGGQTDGLMYWIANNGLSTTYTPSGATSSTPVAIAENFVRDLMRSIAEKFPSAMPNTMLVPPEVKVDINTWTGAGAGNPIVRVLPADAVTTGFVAGLPEVKFYDSGYGILAIREEPNLSPLFNPLLSGNTYVTPIFYNSGLVDNAPLRPLGAEQLARINTSLSRMVTTTFAQEHRIGKHAGQIQYVKSAIT